MVASPAHPRVKFVPSSVDWSSRPLFHPPTSIKPLPKGRAKQFPQIQADASNFAHSATTEARRDAVRDEFVRSYRSYRQFAWMKDELLPVAAAGKDTFGGWAATLVDSLDTLWIMGLDAEFHQAAQAVAALDWGDVRGIGAVNVFETTIRHLGGLLGAFDLSGDPALLRKAVELGDMLYGAFDTPNRLPGFWLNFADAEKGRQVAGINDPSAAPGSLCLEFTRLSQLTGDSKFYDAADRVTQFLARAQNHSMLPGMWPVTLDFEHEQVRDGSFSLGALADSLYEYLPKMHALLGGLDPTFETMYRTAMDVVERNLLFRPMLADQADVLFAGDVHFTEQGDAFLVTESQHLSCFAGGMFALGGRLVADTHHVDLGARLTRGCSWAYGAFASGIMPEIFNLIPCPTLKPCAFDDALWRREGDQRLTRGFRHARDPRYLLRPEAIESVFIMYRVTGDPAWQDMAWDMFQAIVRETATGYANAAIEDVTRQGSPKIDSMESFWLSETLKYFYLIFSPPDLISLDEFVLNTEAHPFRRPWSPPPEDGGL
ncbi:glycoside hydrolase [Dactylonectria macrodidyma]|uniref:alpha-1,2-Mannosidase n=1 Tax=Dactylonectria macrodidyma TaxID=307937 RepID=A0A9P9F755_9HYPO|nr:glycoside hydrolase [Dactylonectria macrodidyma]